MTVIAETLNHRKNYPELDIVGSLNKPNEQMWKTVFKRKCTEFFVTGDPKPAHLVSIRGSFFEMAYPVFDELIVSGTRCPVHAVRRIKQTGNQIIVDLDVAIETPQDSNRIEAQFPHGFSPMCFVHEESQFQYLAIVFHDLEILAVDVTPIGFTVLWDLDGKPEVFLNGRSLGNHDYKIHIGNTEPSTTHDITVKSREDSNLHLEVRTPEMNVESMTRLYRSKKTPEGLHDLSQLPQSVVKYMRQYKILGSGDTVVVNGQVGSKTGPYKTIVSYAGESCDLTEGNLYIVPDFDKDETQFVSFDSDIVEFDNSESAVTFHGKKYLHGEMFDIQNSIITVGRGSLILLIDLIDNPREFTESAEQVLNSGDLVVRDIVLRSMSQVVEKLSGETTIGLNSFFVYDYDTGQTTECTRIKHGLSDDGNTGSVDFDVLYTDTSSAQTMFNTFSSNAEQTSIKTRNVAGDVVSATFSNDGLSFDVDSGGVYFGAGKEFRIQFNPKSGLDPNSLKIQSLDDASGEYITRFLVTDQT